VSGRLDDAIGAVRHGKTLLIAAVDLIRRTGAEQVQIRYDDAEEPVVWFAVAVYVQGRFDAAAAPEPVGATLRLAEQLVDGGQCTHCGKPTGLEPSSLETMPLDELICWYQYDPETEKFRRGCE
jgi:hypothetical protein